MQADGPVRALEAALRSSQEGLGPLLPGDAGQLQEQLSKRAETVKLTSFDNAKLRLQNETVRVKWGPKGQTHSVCPVAVAGGSRVDVLLCKRDKTFEVHKFRLRVLFHVRHDGHALAVRVHVRACARVCVRLRVCVCVRARVCVRVCVCGNGCSSASAS
jgi:hypothetical protein